MELDFYASDDRDEGAAPRASVAEKSFLDVAIGAAFSHSMPFGAVDLGRWICDGASGVHGENPGSDR